MSTTPAGAAIWAPDARAAESTELARYMRWLSGQGVDVGDYDELWRWSVEDVPGFWRSIWDFFDVRAGAQPVEVLSSREMPGARWFTGAELNFAEHLLAGAPEALAVIAVDERGEQREIAYGELADRVGAAQAGLRELGLRRGDRCVALMPNRLETLVAFLACASIGAIWSCTSPEFGAEAVVDRFGQLEPTLLLAVSSYAYGGRVFDRRAEIEQIRGRLPTLMRTVLLDEAGGGARPADGDVVPWSALERHPGEPEFAAVPFEHPLWVLYSSGTTGRPKGIVHGHGGILLESLKQIRLHMDLGPADRFLWFTTTSWMVWNVQIGGLLSGGTIILYDGSPAHPDLSALWRLADRLGVTFLGVSAAFIQSVAKSGIHPREIGDGLAALEAIGSTGSPLSVEGFEWIRDEVKAGIPIFSLSGGTDVCTSFLSATKLEPVYAGEIQRRALGVDAAAFDERGTPVVGEVGELVVKSPMPSMPIALWGDDSGERLRDTYFSTFPGIWRHGDWVTITPRGAAIVHGRSDATLNRGGVRMGGGEFYEVVESIAGVEDSIVVEVGSDATDARLMLFVVLADDAAPDETIAAIRLAIRERISPRHVPDEIRQVGALPRTMNGKKLEVPIKRILQGTPIDQAVSRGSVSDPDALDAFEKLAHAL